MSTITTDKARLSVSPVLSQSLAIAWPNLHRRLPSSFRGAFSIRKGLRQNGRFLGICVTTNNAVLSCPDPRVPVLTPHKTLREAASYLLEKANG